MLLLLPAYLYAVAASAFSFRCRHHRHHRHRRYRNLTHNQSFKEFVSRVVFESGYSDKRGITLTCDDYFHLLVNFSKNGLHFTNTSGATTAGQQGNDITMKDVEDMCKDDVDM
eukprot:GHVU01178318.1.p2 GENE.GHVU01178318.1~~GHVU01178318.1.p2  ORF type:complete len:113 (+),score=14.95 GHVU01178318.1:1818-2156(+)